MRDPRRHIAIVARTITGNTGTSRTILDHARYLTGVGYRVTLIGEKVATDKATSSGAEWCRLLPIKLSSKLKRQAFSWQTSLQVRLRSVDLVWGHGDNLNQDFLSLHNCVHLAHETLWGKPLPQKSGVGMMHKKILGDGRFRKLIANSKLMAADIISRYGIDPAQVAIVYPGFNPKQFNVMLREENRLQIRRSLQIPVDAPVVGLITSGDFQKRGVAEFLQSLAQLPPPLRSQVHGLIIGKDSGARELQRLCSELGLAAQVHILPPTPEIHKFYHSLDLLVHPAKIEEFGQVVQEAIICGSPVLVGSKVGASELFQGAGRRLVLPATEPAAIASAIEEILADPEGRAGAHGAVYDLMRFNTDQANFDKTRVFLEL